MLKSLSKGKAITLSLILITVIFTTASLIDYNLSKDKPLKWDVKTSNLEVGKNYTATAYLINTKTQESFKQDGKEVTATETFVADNPEKELTLTFPKIKNKKINEDVYKVYVTLKN